MELLLQLAGSHVSALKIRFLAQLLSNGSMLTFSDPSPVFQVCFDSILIYFVPASFVLPTDSILTLCSFFVNVWAFTFEP